MLIVRALNHPLEQLIHTIKRNGVLYEVVERPDVLWVGCLDYAANGEPDGDKLLSRFRELLDVEKRELVNPDWSAALWINQNTDDEPRGMMFAQETYSDAQDARYEVYAQPGGLWLRVRRCKETSLALFGAESIDAWEYFACGELRKTAEVNGYIENPAAHAWVGYDCHAEYSTPPHTCYAYLPIIRA